MKIKSFNEYKNLRENNENESTALGTKVSLGDGNQFKPFEISNDPKSEKYGKNKNFAPLVKAFKDGANWGWSKDEDGKDKPVKVGSKKLYLAGGSVRDHLLGKKPRNIELSTSASPDEVYRILKQNEFEFLKNKEDHKSNKSFWIDKVNSKGRPFSFGIKVNEDLFELEVFMKTPRGTNDDLDVGSQPEDASGRDFTINGMYILLSNDNGPNKELVDFFGGAHHLTSKKINTIGDTESKMKEDPSRILRFVRMLNTYGDSSKMSEEEKEKIRSVAKNISKLDKKFIVGEFKKAMEREDSNPRNYLNSCNDLGLTDYMFPGKIIDKEMPKELDELGDKQMPTAWMLRLNDPSSLSDVGFDNPDLNKISLLIKSLNLNPEIQEDDLSDLMTNFVSTGISGRKLRDFNVKLGKSNPDMIDGFLNYTKQPRIKMYMDKDGSETVSKQFLDLVDPFTGELDKQEANKRQKMMELGSFQHQLKFMKKQ